MLIFVDKKKEKRRKIKIFCIICFAVFFIVMNIFHFNSTLHLSNQSLTEYQSPIISNDWYKKADIVYLFNSQQKTKIILIPQTYNRENITTLALAFSKLPSQKTFLSFSQEISDPAPIKEVAALFFPLSNKKTAPQKIIISTSFPSIQKDINQHKLYPVALNYKHTQKLNNINKLTSLLDSLFPTKPAPQNELEEEKEALQKFIEENKITLKDIVLRNKQPPFVLQNIFLSKNRFCLKNTKEKKCSLHSDLSFIKNLQEMTAPKSSLKNRLKLILLTDDSPLAVQEAPSLAKDEGLHFIFNNHEAFLFPEEIKKLDDQKNTLYIIKEKAGINPKYQADTMRLYKFKTLEIDLDDNI